MSGKKIPNELLDQYRAMPVVDVLNRLNVYYTFDREYKPRGDADSKRLIVSVEQGNYQELIVTGNRWYNTRKSVGGGGAIDLVMHLFGDDFLGAVKRLQKKRH